jgi:hypothetical protein
VWEEFFSGSRLGGHVAAGSLHYASPSLFFLPSKLPLSSRAGGAPPQSPLCAEYWDSELLPRTERASERAGAGAGLLSVCLHVEEKNSRGHCCERCAGDSRLSHSHPSSSSPFPPPLSFSSRSFLALAIFSSPLPQLSSVSHDHVVLQRCCCAIFRFLLDTDSVMGIVAPEQRSSKKP